LILIWTTKIVTQDTFKVLKIRFWITILLKKKGREHARWITINIVCNNIKVYNLLKMNTFLWKISIGNSDCKDLTSALLHQILIVGNLSISIKKINKKI